jgi:putative glycosyltransferase
MNKELISVVTTSFNSSEHIPSFYRGMCDVLDAIDCAWEIIIVDDGSTDDSASKCRSICQQDPRLMLIELSRNFGKEAALLEGLRNAKGNLAYLTDSDLEEPPSTLVEMLDVMRTSRSSIDVVYGICRQRKGHLQRRLGGKVFEFFFNILSDVKIPIGILPVRLMTRRYLDAVLMYPERVLALVGIFAYVGFEQRALLVERSYKGYSSYTFARRMGLAVRCVLVFSSKPPAFIAGLGLGVCLISLSSFAFSSNAVADTPKILLTLLLLQGLLLASVGLCAAYLWYILEEVKARPRVIVKSVFRLPST